MVNTQVQRTQALARLVQRHHGRVPDLTARLEAAGFSADNPPDWTALARVPVRAKAELPELQRRVPDFGGLAPTGLVPGAMFWSPGGLREPMVAAAVARLAQLLEDAGLRAGDRVANGFAYHFTPAGLLCHAALERLGATVLPIGPQQTALAAEFMVHAGATGFVGTASHLKALMEAIDALVATQGLPRPALRCALAGAEPFASTLRDEIRQRWGIACRDFYGNAEGGVFALECGQHRGLHLHPDVLWELLDPVTHECRPRCCPHSSASTARSASSRSRSMPTSCRCCASPPATWCASTPRPAPAAARPRASRCWAARPTAPGCARCCCTPRRSRPSRRPQAWPPAASC
jgi:phenylacetate-CoA ligase